MYKIDCESCFKSYIDETGRDLDIRIKEHKFDVKKSKPESGIANRHIETGRDLDIRIKEHKHDVKKSKPESAIANHHIETGQKFNFNNA